MKYVFTDESWEDYFYWQKTDKKKLKRINELLKDIARNPFEEIGKPEPLKQSIRVSGHAGSMMNTGLSINTGKMKF